MGNGSDFLDNAPARKPPQFGQKKDAESIAFAYRMVEDGERLLKVAQMTGLSFNTVHKLRESWREMKEDEKRVETIRSVPKIRLSDAFILHSIQTLDTDPKYYGDPFLGPMSSILAEIISLRKQTGTSVL